MNTQTNTPKPADKPASIVDAIFELGIAWAEVGLVQGKTALESTARALSRTAHSLEVIRERLASELPQQERAADDGRTIDVDPVKPEADTKPAS